MAEADHEPVPGWTPPTARERLALIREHRNVAMVGVSSNPARPSNFVATYLLSYPQDFDVSFVNPRETEILGRPVSHIRPAREPLPTVAARSEYSQLSPEKQLAATVRTTRTAGHARPRSVAGGRPAAPARPGVLRRPPADAPTHRSGPVGMARGELHP